MTGQSLDAAELERAFHAFNAHSRALEGSYRDLEARVATLTAELAEARTARHRELLAKEQLSERLSLMLEALPGAVVILDAAGVIRERNREAAELLNQPLVGRPWSAIVRREFNAAASADGDLELNDGRILNLRRRPLAAGGGDILLLTDVTESRRLRELLARHQRLSAIGEMTARLAHQIRTPLASALLYASQVSPGEDPATSVGGRIVARLRELDRLVRDMLQFAGGSRDDDRLVDLETLLEDVAETCRGRAGACRIAVAIAGPALAVAGNRDALKGALANLVDNAAAACGDDGRVELGAVRDGDTVAVTVSDNGGGIPAELHERIFEPFFTTRPQGTGLGLPVVRAVARAHGGDVVVDTGAAGCTFAIRLPAARLAAAEFAEHRHAC